MSTCEYGESNRVGAATLPTPAYHGALAAHLQSTEPELWRWFKESSAVAQRQDDSAELELLKSAYRLDGGMHEVLVGHAAMLASRFEIAEPIVLYQELGDGQRNARVFRLNRQVHVVFSGDLLDLLSVDEQHAVLAHELAHIALWQRESDCYFVLDHLVHRLASEPLAADAVIETARRLRLHTEVWADAASAEVIGSVPTVVSAVVKINAGLRHVDPEAYLRQAAQVLELDSSASEAWSHPELHIRVACIEARNREASADVISQLVSGPDDLERLDILGQARIQQLAAQVVKSGSQVIGANDGTDTYLRSYPELAIDGAVWLHDGEIAEYEPSIRWMAAALLVDLALADGATEQLDELRALSTEAVRHGTGVEFDKILARATDRTAAEAARIREGHA